MQAYCSLSFALKLAVFCLLIGIIVGVYLSSTVRNASAGSGPSPSPTTQVAHVLPGHPK